MSEQLPQLPDGVAAPDVLGAVEGWRSWWFHPHHGLQSVFALDYWSPQHEMVARCPHSLFLSAVERGRLIPRHHKGPVRGCRCGIYVAAKGNWNGIPRAHIYGKAQIWGDVIPGSKAHRGQYAYPSELYAPPGLIDHPMLKAYGVPIRRREELPWQLRLRLKWGFFPRERELMFAGLWMLLAAASFLSSFNVFGVIPYASSCVIIALCAIVVLSKG